MSRRIIIHIDEIAVGAWSLQEWTAHIGGRMPTAQPMFFQWTWWDRIRLEGTMVVDERGSTSWWLQFLCQCWTVSTCRRRKRRPRRTWITAWMVMQATNMGLNLNHDLMKEINLMLININHNQKKECLWQRWTRSSRWRW